MSPRQGLTHPTDTVLSRNGKSVLVDGLTLSIPAITAAARYLAPVQIDGAPSTKQRVANSRAVIAEKVKQGVSIYGVSTGFGGSGEREPYISAS
jgi:phenylalanine ammonia-lyase